MSLCDSCVHAHIYERANAMRQYHCLRLQAVKIPGDIVSCSDHDLRTAIDLWDMKQMAWRVEPGINGRIRGFRPPKEE